MVDLSSMFQVNLNTCIIIASSFFTGFLMGKSVKHIGRSFYKVPRTVSKNSRPAIIDTFKKYPGPTKLVLVLRQDIKLTKGKAASQCAHGTLIAYNSILEKEPALLKAWEYTGQAKVVVKAPSLEVLETVQKEATKVGLNTSVVQDAGRTQVEPGTLTVMAVGPGPVQLIDQVTGHLKLY